MYVLGFVNKKIFQYTLSSAWDISTASYDNVAMSTNSSGESETTSWDVAFKDDGLKMFVVGDDNDQVYQHTLSSAFDISTASYDFATSTNSSGEGETNPRGLAFKSDGTKMFVVGNTNAQVYQYTLGVSGNQTLSGTMTGTSAFNDVLFSFFCYAHTDLSLTIVLQPGNPVQCQGNKKTETPAKLRKSMLSQNTKYVKTQILSASSAP